MIKQFIKELVFRIRGEYTTEKLVRMGMTVGKHFGREEHVILDPSFCWLITIGDYVTLAPNVVILCHDASTRKFIGFTKCGCVSIGDHVFVGAGSYILPGVKIGDNVVIGANSTVTHNVPSNSVYAGSPAKFIMSIEEFKLKNKEKCGLLPFFEKKYSLSHKVPYYLRIKQKEILQNTNTMIGFID